MRMVAAVGNAGICMTVADVFGHPLSSDLSALLPAPDRLDLSAEKHNHPQFLSLNFSDVGKFLEETVCPQIASERSNIEDVL